MEPKPAPPEEPAVADVLPPPPTAAGFEETAPDAVELEPPQAEATPEAPAPEPAPAEPAQDQPAEQPADAEPAPAHTPLPHLEESVPQTKSHGNGMGAIIAMTFVIVVVLSGIAVFAYLQSKK